MKIISGTDYYDTCAQYGIDNTIRLIRYSPDKAPLVSQAESKLFITESIGISCVSKFDGTGYGKSTIHSPYDAYLTDKKQVNVNVCDVIIADTFYRVLRITPIIKGGVNGKPFYIHDNNTLKLFCKEHDIQIKMRGADMFLHSATTLDLAPRKLTKEQISFMVDKGYSILTHISPYLGAPPRDNKDLVLSWKANIYGLDKIEFQKVVHPFEMFQTLDMWISGVLSGMSPKTVTISDEVRLEKHGFDKKWSFRRHKDDPKV